MLSVVHFPTSLLTTIVTHIGNTQTTFCAFIVYILFETVLSHWYGLDKEIVRDTGRIAVLQYCTKWMRAVPAVATSNATYNLQNTSSMSTTILKQ